MKLSIYKMIVLSGIGLCSGMSLRAADVIPKGYPVERYAPLWEHSPFTLSSVQEEKPQAGFAEKLVLAGIASLGSGDIVTLVNRDTQERITVTTEPNLQGLSLVSVETNDDPLQASATIKKGSEVARVKFDKALLAVVAAPVQGNPSATFQQSAGQPVPPNINPGVPPAVSRIPRRQPISIPGAAATPTPIPVLVPPAAANPPK